jgi:ABC-type uncharacterized transport system YnjBCD ATPase subunit
MHLRKITIRNIKSFTHFELNFMKSNGEINRWTTLFGHNGLGKSTLLQAIGVTLAGPSAIRELLPVAENWVRHGEPYGELTAELLWTDGDSQIAGRPPKKALSARYIVTGDDPDKLPEALQERYYYSAIVPWSGEGAPKEKEAGTKDMKRLQQTAYAEGRNGWLACGYGPFRRLSGGGQEADRILYAERIAARFITLFREDAALTNTTEWLIKLHNTAREGNPISQQALQHIKQAFARDLFPKPVELLVDASRALLRIDQSDAVPLYQLSDGYRSMLALALDLLRWLIQAFPDAANPLECYGVVLIDELDAHLHPNWQRQIGYWLRQKFPNIQFIVATHSPFLAQVADTEETNNRIIEGDHEGNGIVRLIQTEDGVQALGGLEPVQDLRVDQILMSPLFDLDSLYSPKTEEKLKKHDELNIKKESEEGLTALEHEEYHQLELWRESLPLLTAFDDREYERSIKSAIDRYQKELQNFE